MKVSSFVLSLLAACLILFPVASAAQDRTEFQECSDCHIPPPSAGPALMDFTAATWLFSDHANSNHGFNQRNFCAECHSPLDADPNDPAGAIPLEDWQAVTCSSCHLPHALAVIVGTRVGNFVVGSGDQPNSILPEINGEWEPIFHGEENDLCVNCHTGPGHPGDQEFQAFGKVMFKHKGVRCIDCHMPKIPIDVPVSDSYPDGIRPSRTHVFSINAGDEDFVRYSCGTEGAGCHANHKTDWAVKQIGKGKIHGK
jgi:nitrate/TMAO reductase-like tetraheme cytochrome c subunit